MKTQIPHNSENLFIYFLIILSVLCYETVNAADRYSVATGNWNSTNTWSATSGGSPGASVPGSSDNAFIEGGYTVTVTANAQCVNLSVAGIAGSTLTVGGFTLTVSGTTTINRNITFNNATGTKTFTGNVIINNTGVWNETAAAAFSFAGNLQNDGTFTASTGVHTFTGTAKTISGANAIAIPSLTISGTTTNSGTLTVSTTMAGTSTLTNGSGATLNFGGSSITPTLTATANPNIVNYNGTAQTVKLTTYSNLTLSTSGAKTFSTGTTTVNGILSMEGTATVTLTGTIAYGTGATLQYKGSSAQTTGGEFPSTFSGTGGVIINNTNGVILGSSCTISNLLTFTNGKITTNTNVLSLGSGATVSGAGAGKYVYGNLLWNIPNTGSPSRVFYIGDATNYTPVQIDLHTMSGNSGTLTGYTTAGDHVNIGSSGIDPAKSVNRTWTFTNSGMSFTDYDATFTFVTGDIDAGATTSGFIVRKFFSPDWSSPQYNGAALATTTKAIGFTSFSGYQIGDPSTQTKQTFTDEINSFLVPQGITSLDVECWGGGGAGGGATGNPTAGGGGAGGTYVKQTISVTPGSTYSVVVGASKTGTNSNTQAQNQGNPSWFGSTNILYAQGGQGGTPATANSTNGAAGSGSTSGSIGTIKYAGGNGATGIYTSGTPGGAGGGGAGSTGAGGNASAGTAGTGTSLNGGNGAAGVANSTAGGAGSNYGGGGSGGKANSTTDRAGGNGAQGLVVVSWANVFADLQITKSVDNPTPAYGNNVIFTLTVHNGGTGNASSVKVNDQLSSGYVYISHTSPGSTTYDPAAGLWNIGTLNNGSSLILYITAKVVCNGDYTNVAYVTGKDPDPDNNNNMASTTTAPTGSACPLVAVDDISTTFQETPVTIIVLSNDHGNIVAASTAIVTQPQNGILQNNNGVFTYTPNPSFTGTDQFVYRIFDNTVPVPLQDDAVVTIIVESNFANVCYEANRGHIYYMPFPENETQLAIALYDAAGGTGATNLLNNNYIRNITSIKSPYPDVIIIYDQWEDGYEADITVPAQQTTQVWGDRDLTNGIAPGYSNDIIPAGGSIVLDNIFRYKPRNSANIYYDGKDKIFSTQDIAISKITGDNVQFNIQCAKTDVYDINRFSKAFTVGLGENLNGVPTGVTAFKYVCLFIRAAYDGTTVSLDYDGGGVDLTKSLNEGEVWFYEGPPGTINGTGDIRVGATVTATKPVGLDVLFGGQETTGYGTRNFNVLPNTFYGNTYYTPVPTVASANPALVYFYNDNAFNIVVNWTSGGGTTTSGTVSVNTKSTGYLYLDNAYGYKFQSQLIGQTRPTFVANEILDCPNGVGSYFDWAFPLIREERLTNFTSIAWAPGAGDVPISMNDGPIWMTPVSATTIYVKRDGDLTASGPYTSPCNLPYDTAITLNALQFYRWKDYTDKDQSGTALYTCNGSALNGVPFAAVYGEDASTATAAGPSIDVGTVMQPRCLSQFIVANDDFEETPPNTPIIIGVSSNDVGYLCNLNPISVTTTGLLQPSNGTIVINPDGTITYTPNPGFTGVDVFEYSICSIEYPAICDVATVTVTVASCTAESTENLINGKVFVDRPTYNGTLDPGEIFAAGVQVDLYGDINCDNQISAGEIIEQSVFTDLSGNYQFATYNGYHAEDNFDPTASFSGNDGSVPWSTNWVEQGDDGVINTGDVRILLDNAPGATGNAIRIGGPDNGISRTLAFSGATSATLKFTYRRQGLLNNGAALLVQINSNTLYVLDDGNGVGTDNYYRNVDLTIPSGNFNANGSNTVLFLSTSALTTAEFFYIDNVELAYFSGQTCFVTQVNPSTSNGLYAVSPGGGSTAAASFSSLGQCDNGNNLAVVSIKTDLSVTKTDFTGSYGPGNSTVYTVVVYNAGPADVVGATVSDPVPSGTTITGWTATFSGGATGNSSGGSGPLNETVDIPVYGSITYLITVAIPCTKTGNLVNTATVSPPSGITDNDPSNNSSTDTDVQNIWFGYNSTDWNDPGNWSIGVPSCTPDINAVIPYPVSSGRYPVINSTGNKTSHLLIENGAKLTINPGKDLTVCGCTEINGPCGLNLESDETNGNASFVTSQTGTITYPNGGTACVDLWLRECVGYTGCWHYISSPITNAVAGVFDGDYMKSFNEQTGSWSDYITTSGVPLNVLQGYIVSNQTSGIRTFEGQLNDGTVQQTLYRHLTSARKGWNLVGNPYPSEIDLNTTLDWTNVDKIAYYYDMMAGNYLAYIGGPYGFGLGTRYVPSMQGFFVHVYDGGPPDYNNTSGIIKFTDDNRTTTGDVTFYKDLPSDLILLKVQGNTDLKDQLIVYFNPGLTNGYDQDLDAIKLPGSAGSPQLCAVASDNTKLTIDGLSFEGVNTIVPLEFYVNNGTGNYSITAEKLESFRPGTTVTLEDKKTQTTQELNVNPVYHFNYTDGDDPARFLLHFNNPFYGIEDLGKAMELQIYSSGQDVYLKDLTGNPEKGDFYLYNLMGQQISHKLVAGITLNKYTFDLPNGYYIVKVITKDKTYNAKVYIN